MLELLTFIAQTDGGSGGAPQPMAPCGQPGMLFPLVLMGFVFYFLLIRPQSREKKRRAEMIAAIKKNDRVTTIGGIVGTVLSVKDDEVTLKVDESNNTKITFTRGAIQSITSAGGADGTSTGTGKD